jgi:hypothetical protein
VKGKEKFVKKRKYALPLDTFIEIELSKKNKAKIQGWIKNRDSISIVPSANSIVLLNETKRM